jgi:hypothetical protein
MTSRRVQLGGAPALPVDGPWQGRVALRIARFESAGDPFTALNKSTATSGDGQGVSMGLIQWTQRSGNLGRLLASFRAADPSAFEAITQGRGGEIVSALTASSESARLAPIAGYPLWDPWWTSKLVALGSHPPFQRVQLEAAATGDHMQAALTVAKRLGPRAWSERAMAVFYDRTVQTYGRALDTASALARAGGGSVSLRAPEWVILDQYISSIADQFERGGKTWQDIRIRRGSSLLNDPELRDVAVFTPPVA